MTNTTEIIHTESQHVTLESLFQAYFDCRHNKRRTMNALAFEADYERNLVILCDEINRGDYHPGRSIAFVVTKPVNREIFAADFRDRVVHHWVSSQLNPLFERAFIYDSYASRKGQGVHVGIQRANRFIRQCSHHYSRDCYVLKLDIKNFFIRINKHILLAKLHPFIELHYPHPNQGILLELISKVVLNDPTTNCFIKSNKRLWNDFPPDKSLFHGRPSCGLPIGNFTSQIFANFYLNSFDHFVKHDLGVRFYGRYVDDFILVHEEQAYLKALIPTLAQFLHEELQLDLHPRKIHLQHYAKGVNFLGVTIKPNRIYIGKRTKGNFYDAITQHNNKTREKKPSKEEQAAFLCSVNSYLGLMKHYNTYRLRRRMLRTHLSIWWWNLMYLSGGASKLVPKQRTIR